MNILFLVIRNIDKISVILKRFKITSKGLYC